MKTELSLALFFLTDFLFFFFKAWSFLCLCAGSQGHGAADRRPPTQRMYGDAEGDLKDHFRWSVGPTPLQKVHSPFLVVVFENHLIEGRAF